MPPFGYLYSPSIMPCHVRRRKRPSEHGPSRLQSVGSASCARLWATARMVARVPCSAVCASMKLPPNCISRRAPSPAHQFGVVRFATGKCRASLSQAAPWARQALKPPDMHYVLLQLPQQMRRRVYS